MANRKVYGVTTPKNEVQLLSAKLTGGGAADMVNAESANMGGGEVSSAVRSGTGAFALKMRKTYPELKSILGVEVVGTTTGLSGIFTAFDPKAGTATLQLSVGSVATDPATSDTVYLTWLVRNSGQNK